MRIIHDVIEDFKSLSLEDKLYVLDVEEKLIAEDERKRIKSQINEGLQEFEAEKISFSNSSMELKRELDQVY